MVVLFRDYGWYGKLYNVEVEYNDDVKSKLFIW